MSVLLQKPAGAYIFFCQDKRAGLKAEQPDLSASDILKELGALWKETSEEEKKVCKLQLPLFLISLCSFQV